MAVQPTGTVTLLLTDIEGSTSLLERLGRDRYAKALEVHRSLLRAAFERHEGYEVDCVGDAFFVAFPHAEEAVAAAADAQRALAGAVWPEGLELRVRMGIHTGEPLPVPPRYVGMDVHRAARVMAAGHGGQVVLTAVTRDLLGDRVDVRDLGEHRLKDLSGPLRLFQIGGEEFPPLKTLYRANLPVPATPFVGRENEVREIAALLEEPVVRIVTVLGPGGAGKTRLALQAAAAAADAFPDGVTWVPLAPLRDPSLVAGTIAQALDVREQFGLPVLETLVERLAGQRRLLLLDNAEHLLPELSADIARLRDASGLTIVVTSRERLQVAGEHAWAVPAFANEDAIELFVSRAREIDRNFAHSSVVDELCRRLDNLPLALELAAARTSLFTPEQLLERLSERLDLFKGPRDADPRHATLRATIDWSYDLLAPKEQQLLRRLSLFASGCTYETASAVCDADPDTLQALIDKSLLRRRETAAEPRYWMLETIRQHAQEQVVAQEDDAMRGQLIDASMVFAAAAEPSWLTPDTTLWQRRFELELDNLRQALDYALVVGRPEHALAIAGDLTGFWQRAGLIREGTMWVERALAAVHDPEQGVEGMALFCLGVLAFERGDAPRTLELMQRALPRVERSRPEIAVFVLYMIAELSALIDPVGARERMKQAREEADSVGNPTLRIITTIGWAELIAEDDPEGARVLATTAVELARNWNSSYHVEALQHLAELVAASGDYEHAANSLEEAEVIVAADETLAALLFDTLALSAILAVLSGDAARASWYLGRLRDLDDGSDEERPGRKMRLALIEAALSVYEGHALEAVVAWSRADVYRESMSKTWDRLEARVVADVLEPVRQQLDAAAFNDTWQRVRPGGREDQRTGDAAA